MRKNLFETPIYFENEGAAGGGGDAAAQAAAAAAAAQAAAAAAAAGGGAAGGGQQQQTAQPLTIDGRPMTQDDLTRLLAREKDEGKRAATTDLLTTLGAEKIDDVKTVIDAVRAADDAQKTEAQRATEAATAAAAAAAKTQQDAADLIRRGVMREALRDEGAPKAALDDLTTLLAAQIGAGDLDEPKAVEGAKALKTKYPALFGTAGGGAPNGDPAGGPGGAGGGAATGIEAGAARAKAEQEARDKAAGGAGASDPLAAFHKVGG